MKELDKNKNNKVDLITAKQFESQINKAKESLNSLLTSNTAPRKISNFEKLKKLNKEVQALFKAGYTKEQISEQLQKANIYISPRTLMQYMRDIKSGKKDTTKAKQKQDTVSSNVPENPITKSLSTSKKISEKYKVNRIKMVDDDFTPDFDEEDL
ncbi:hypothetical protein [Endozoicomonas euniceicola]|uniref:Uncharacterized protein n=1 Tax=Endozoicomonas euniceicola TaxID=1234143 RepID=A0ABY6H385_9GAMM|nr:hypothetical protein [Endozoicomonas euniceicola]UYM18589.1 hypothetical protein NX720_12035 [Endozoicomonas euniceicola]